nr:unnamed protein product [Callosobruchus chinensis]
MMADQAPMEFQRYCLRWNNHMSNILQMISQHHMKEKFVDVVLVCEDHYIKVHRLILSACSEFFGRSIVVIGRPAIVRTVQMEEAVLNEIERNPETSTRKIAHELNITHVTPYIVLTGVKFEHLKYIIDFMYSGEIKVLDKDIEDILTLGEKLKVKGLCSVVLKERVSLTPQVPPTETDSQKRPKSTKPIPVSVVVPPTKVKQKSLSPNRSIPEVPSQMPKAPIPHDQSLPKKGITSDLHTLVHPPSVDDEKTVSGASTQQTLLSINIKTSAPKVLPKIQIRHPSVINAIATARCDEKKSGQEDVSKTTTGPPKNPNPPESNKQTTEKSKRIELSIVSSGQKSTTNTLKASTKRTVDTPTFSCKSREEGGSTRPSGDSSAMPKDSVPQKVQKQSPSTPVACYEGAQSDNIFDISNIPPILRKGIKRKLTSSKTLENAPASVISDSCTSKPLAEVKRSPSKPRIIEVKSINSKNDLAKSCVTLPNTKATSRIEIIDEEVKSPINSVSTTSVGRVEIGDEEMVDAKEGNMESKTSNRTVLIRDRVDVMKNGTQVPKKVLEEEQKKSINPFMLHMWKSLEPESKRIYYRRARQAVKEEG